jgi:hypothetical protein
MARQFGEHTDLSQEILKERQLAAEAKVKTIKLTNYICFAAFILIGSICVLYNVFNKSSLKKELATITQSYESELSEYNALLEISKRHDDLIAKHATASSNILDIGYDDAVKEFTGDVFVDSITPIEAKSLTEMCDTLSDLQTRISQLFYTSFYMNDGIVSKEQGDLILESRNYISTKVPDVWAKDMIEEYITSHAKDKDQKYKNVPDDAPFIWVCDCDYTYSVFSDNIKVVWRCVSKTNNDVVYAIAVGNYSVDQNLIVNLSCYKTSEWNAVINKVKEAKKNAQGQEGQGESQSSGNDEGQPIENDEEQQVQVDTQVEGN